MFEFIAYLSFVKNIFVLGLLISQGELDEVIPVLEEDWVFLRVYVLYVLNPKILEFLPLFSEFGRIQVLF